MSDVENLWRNWSSQSMKSTRRRGYTRIAFKRRSGCPATHFNYCAGMTVILEAKLPIYEKPSMAHRVTWHLRLLRPLKCLTALKNLQQVLELYRYDALNMLNWMTLDVKNIHSIEHHKDKLFTVLDYSRNFENAAKEGWKTTTHWEVYHFTNPNSWCPVPERALILSATPEIVNRYHQYRWHHRACRRWGTGHKQRWQELELPRCTSITD